MPNPFSLPDAPDLTDKSVNAINMPATSKKQFRLMKAICEGTYPDGYRGISKKVACEFVKEQSPKGLPLKKRKTQE